MQTTTPETTVAETTVVIDPEQVNAVLAVQESHTLAILGLILVLGFFVVGPIVAQALRGRG